ncbi:MAG TPA: argininosuccinate lyase, partial [Caulobacteraceae bacterium]|nr:argininosuccinate lyase [Caulobacteraceae bacterium]
MPRNSSESVGVSKDPRNESGDQPRGNLLWGGRFSAKPDALMQAINVSIGFDKRLAIEDLAGSKAHVAMLGAGGIISADDEAAIQRGLADIEQEIEAGTFPFRDEFEDIHLNVEKRLE